MLNIQQPKDKNMVKSIEALRCYFGGDRPVTANELKQLSKDERHELARMVCEDQGWKYVLA